MSKVDLVFDDTRGLFPYITGYVYGSATKAEESQAVVILPEVDRREDCKGWVGMPHPDIKWTLLRVLVWTDSDQPEKVGIYESNNDRHTGRHLLDLAVSRYNAVEARPNFLFTKALLFVAKHRSVCFLAEVEGPTPYNHLKLRGNT